jgi:hypothetical protein
VTWRAVLTACVCALGLSLVGAQGCGPQPTPPQPPPAIGGYPGTGGSPSGGSDASGGGPAVDGFSRCAAALEASPGATNVVYHSGESLQDAITRICSSPELQTCFAEGRCQ